MYYIETRSHDPCYNLAFEEYLLQKKREGDWLLLWQNHNTVVIGMNQNPLEEVDQAFVRRHHIQVVRRMTGGGAVYHDLGNLNYSFITDAGGYGQLSMERFTSTICQALVTLGVSAQVTGRNDITVGNKKVSGTAQRLSGSRILHHGTLLFDSDPDMIAGALRADPRKFISKSTKSVRSRVGNIREFLPQGTTLSDFWAQLRQILTQGQAELASLTPAELDQVEELAGQKYRSWEWTYSASPRFTLRRSARLPEGSLTVEALVQKGNLEEIAFTGDFLAQLPLDPLKQALTGCPFTREAVAPVLDANPLQEQFGGITAQEILDLLFDPEEEEMQ